MSKASKRSLQKISHQAFLLYHWSKIKSIFKRLVGKITFISKDQEKGGRCHPDNLSERNPAGTGHMHSWGQSPPEVETEPSDAGEHLHSTGGSWGLHAHTRNRKNSRGKYNFCLNHVGIQHTYLYCLGPSRVQFNPFCRTYKCMKLYSNL